MKMLNQIYAFAGLLVLVVACSQPPRIQRLSQPSKPVEETKNNKDGADSVGQESIAINLQALGTQSPYPRLSHRQWENAVQDLLYLNAAPGNSKNFPDDDVDSVFGNNGALLSVSADQWTAYRSAAEEIADRVSKEPSAIKKITGGETDPKAIVSAFLRRAWRRPATDTEVAQTLAFFQNGPKLSGKADPIVAGLYVLIDYVLQSPNFLYRIELGNGIKGDYVALSPYEVAARLSFTIWNTAPDETLSKLADNGTILQATVLRDQADRLLSDPRGRSFIKDINLRGLAVADFQYVAQDPKTYPEASGLTTALLQKEVDLFFQDVLVTQNKGFSELLTAPYAFVSPETAAAYEVSASSSEASKVDLDPNKRAGYLTQLAFLSHFSKNDGATAIVKRGHYVAETLLCGTFTGAPPSPDITGRQMAYKTNREFTAALTETPGCAGCHATHINPPGYAFENFGPTGKFRTAELNGTVIDAKSTYAFNDKDTITFDGAVELIKEIVKRPELHQCYAKKLVEAFYGRYADAGDATLIEVLGKASEQGGSTREMILTISSHPLMTMRSNK